MTMNRRQFTKIAAALASLFAQPSSFGAASQVSAGTSEHHPSKITRLRIGAHTTSKLRENNRLDRLAGKIPTSLDPLDDDDNYWAEAIEDGDRFYYRAKDITIEIEEYEFRRVVENPSLYYFSTALKLHFRIERAKARDFFLLSGYQHLPERPCSSQSTSDLYDCFTQKRALRSQRQ